MIDSAILMSSSWRLNSPLPLFDAGEQGLWYDPSDFSTMFQDSAGTIPVTSVGDPVGLIRDKSPRGNHASQPTNSKRPTLGRDANGAYYLKFDGVDDFLSVSLFNLSSTSALSAFYGVSKVDNSGRIICEHSVDFNANAGSFYIVCGTDGGGIGYTSASRGTASPVSGQLSKGFTFSGTDTAVISVTHDIPGDLSTMRRNATAMTNGTSDKGAGNFGNFPFFIGSRTGVSTFFNGKLYQLIIRGSLSTSGEIASAESFINNKIAAY